jgi:hypothetical protein
MHDDADILLAFGRAAVRRKLTITVDEEVYDGLHRIVGRRHIGRFFE